MNGTSENGRSVEGVEDRMDLYTLVRCPECGRALAELVSGAIRCLCRRCGKRFKIMLVCEGDYIPPHLRRELDKAVKDAADGAEP